MTYTSDKFDGPTAGPHTFEATAFIARLVDHIPDKGQVPQRYYGYYANRTRRVRRKAQAAEDAMRVADVADVAEVAEVMRTDAELPPGGVTSESKGVSLADAQRRWADLLRRIYEGATLDSCLVDAAKWAEWGVMAGDEGVGGA